MSTRHREVERTFSPGSDSELPDLAAVEEVQRMADVAEVDLDARYFDTPDLALLRAGVTLRRRSGGADQGWHLKLPVRGAPGSRDELHSPLDGADGEARPPEELGELVAGWTRGVGLAEVARIRTRRRIHHLLDGQGSVLAEVADDRVTGTPAGPAAAPVTWREWEVELVSAGPDLLDQVERVLGEHGVGRSPVQRKIALVLGDLHRAGADPAEPSKDGPARLLVHRWIAEQVREIEVLDPVARRLGPGGVHGMRKACRRLRAALAAYRPLLDRERTDPLGEELRWLARSLSDARDAEVVQARIEALVEDQAAYLVVGPVRERLQRRREQHREDDLRAVAELLTSSRYLALRAGLDALVADPPWNHAAEEPAGQVLPPRVRKEWKRARGRHRSGVDPHEVRKAVKRLRHAYELLEPVWGAAASDPAEAAQELTQVLGERQDAVAARATLLDLAAEATAAGESAFTYGRLHALEEQAERDLLAEAERVWKTLKKLRW